MYMTSSYPAPPREREGMTRSNNNLMLDEFVKRLCTEHFGYDLGRVEYKFVRSMLVGILRTRSVNLTNIAKDLDEHISLHATQKRLSRNLDNPALSASLADRLLKLGAETVRPDTQLIVHVYELNKKYARKVEYLSVPELESGGGFKVCEILASDPDSDTYTPLLTKVWSEKVPGYISDVEEIKKVIHRVLVATGNKGMLYFDDQSLSGDFLTPLMEEPSFNFISMMKDTEIDVLYRKEPCALKTLVERAETPYGRTVFKLVPEGMLDTSKTDLDLFMHVGAMAIKLPDCNRNLSLISLRSKSRLLGENVMPMITSKTNLRSRKALMGLVESFLSVQDVLTSHQSLRDSFEPASFRVLTYSRLQLLMTLLQAAIHYEVSMLGNGAVDGHLFSVKPHDGDLHRTYHMPS